jgi:tRNA A-37 threonylcarbamoyl transferase component Bud32
MDKIGVARALEKRFPAHEFDPIYSIDRSHSKIFVFQRVTDSKEDKILIKYYKNTDIENVLDKYNHQKLFYDRIEGISDIKCPKLISVDKENDISIMEYVEGSTLKSLLTNYRSLEKDSLETVITKSALGLAKFHKSFESDDPRSYNQSVAFFEDYILKDRISITEEELNNIGKLSLDSLSNSFIDFSPPNIIVDTSSVYLIDFPNRERLSTPHLDLARFKFYLRLMKQYPRFKIPPLNWWEVDEIFQLFLEVYCEDVGKRLNRSDLYIINKLQKEFAAEINAYYDNENMGIKDTLSKYYLRRFTRNIIEEENLSRCSMY